MSTGLQRRVVQFDQPSSSGQTVNVTTGCRINIWNGADMCEPVTVNTSAAKAVTNYGVSILKSTIANTFTIATPRAGLLKTLVCYSTLTQTVRGSSAVGVRFGSTAGSFYSLTVSNTTKSETRGRVVILAADSTKRWNVLSWSTLLNSGHVAFSTACT